MTSQTHPHGSLVSLFFLCLLASLCACGGADDADTADTEDTAAATDAGTVPFDVGETERRACPGTLRTGAGGEEVKPKDFESVNYLDSSEVSVLFCNAMLEQPPKALLFYFVITDHFGMPVSDLTQPTWAQTSDGRRTEGAFVWDGEDLTDKDHHVEGHLSGPATTKDGVALLGDETTWLELHIGGFGASGKDLVFRWEKAQLP